MGVRGFPEQRISSLGAMAGGTLFAIIWGRLVARESNFQVFLRSQGLRWKHWSHFLDLLVNKQRFEVPKRVSIPKQLLNP